MSDKPLAQQFEELRRRPLPDESLAPIRAPEESHADSTEEEANKERWIREFNTGSRT